MAEGCVTVASVIQNEGLDKIFWLPKFEELGINHTTALQHAEGDMHTYFKLKKQAKHDWEGQALRQLLKIDLEKEKQKLEQESGKAQQILQELQKLCSELKDRSDVKVKKLENDMCKMLQISPDSWISSDKSLHELIAKVEGQLQYSGILQARDSLNDSSLLQKVSGGLALQGILLTKDISDQLQGRNRLLDVPQHVVIAGASEAKDFKQYFTSIHQEDEYEKKLNVLGHSVAIFAQAPVYEGITIGGGVSYSHEHKDEHEQQHGKKQVYSSTVKYSIIHVASYSFDECDLRICEDAKRELNNILRLHKQRDHLQMACEAFFQKYGSHVNTGPLHFGGRLKLACSSTGFSSEETETVRMMQNDAVSTTAGFMIGGFGASTSVDLEQVKGSYKGRFKGDTLVNTYLNLSISGGPPEVSDLEAWKAGLVANKSTWILTDRGQKLVAVWDIIRNNYHGEFGEIAEELRKTWEEMTGLKAQHCVQPTLAYNSEKVLDEVREWNEKTLTARHIKDNIEFLVEVKKDILDKTSNPKIWIEQYLSQQPVQFFMKSVMTTSQSCSEYEHIKFLMQRIIEQNDMSHLTTRNFPDIEQIANWLYEGTQQFRTSMKYKNCSDFESFSELLNEIEREYQITMLNATEPLLGSLTSELGILEALATDISVAVHELRSHFKQKYEDVLITILVHKFQSGNHDNVITFKPMTLNDLKELHSLFVKQKKEFDRLSKEKNPLQLQAFLFHVAIDLCHKNEDIIALLQLIKQMMTDLDPPLSEELIKNVNDYSIISNEDFKEILESFMSLGHPIHQQHHSLKENEQSLKTLLKTAAIEHIVPFHQGSESDIFHKNQAAHSIFEQLGLCGNYLNKMQLQDVLCIGQEYLSLSLKEYPLRNLKQLPGVVLHKLMSYDYLCRSDLIPQDTSYDDISDDESLSDDSSESQSSSHRNIDKKLTKIHPVDVLLALFLCSDNLLRQDLFSRLAKCQLAVPFLLLDPFSEQLTLPLWAMHAIVKDWKCLKDSKGRNKFTVIEYSEPIIQYGMPIVSFIRIGKRQSRGASKSKLLNEVISDSHYDHFFHCDCPGGLINRVLGEGMVDMCWYLPAGERCDIFPDAITFLNLHGDARKYPHQANFLSQISSMCFLLICEDNLILDSTTVDNLKQMSLSHGGITVLNDVENAFKCESVKLPSIKLTNKNADEIKVSVRKRIKRKIQFDQCFMGIEDSCTAEVITQNKISTDKSSESFKHGFLLAKEVIDTVTNFYYEKESIKEEVIPLQGETWLAWAEKHKEFYRQIHRGKETVNKYAATIRREKKIIRQQQLKHVNSLSPVMILFIVSILKLRGKSNKKVRSYFLQCLKLGLDNLSRGKISRLLHRYKAIGEQLAEATAKVSSDCDSVDKEHKKLPVQAPTSKSQDGIHRTHEINEHKKELELLQKQIIHSSFGLEHLFRELGQVYEAARESSEYGEELSCLPQAVAEILTDGHPLELMDGDTAHVPMQWVSAVLKETITILNDPKVYVVSVLGIQSSGKSTMLNTLFGLQFNISAGRCTRGAFMQLLPLDEELKQQTECHYVLVVDTEGLRAPELDFLQTQKHDNELATFVIGLANVTLININGENQGNIDDILQTSVHAFLRMHQVKYNPSCQFIHQNAGASLKNQVGRNNFTSKLNKFTIDAAREEGCEGLCKTFNDVIAFDDHKDVHYFPGLWKGDPPMAPVNQGYSNSAQMLKYNLIELLFDKTSRQTAAIIYDKVEDLSLSTFKMKVIDLWEALLKENFIFSFKNTLEITAYNSLEIEYGMLEWKFHKTMLDWEVLVENQINAANPDQVPYIMEQRCEELQKIISETYEHLKKEMKDFIQRSEILVQWKAKFEIKLKNRSQELQDQATNYCKKLGRSKEAITKFENERTRYTAIITDKVKDVIATLKKEQQKLNESLERGHLDEYQLKELSKQDLFSLNKLSRYERQELISTDTVHKIIGIKEKFKDQPLYCVQHIILLDGILSSKEVKAILNQGRLREDELKDEFDKQWIKLVDSIPWVEDRPVNVAAAVERQLIAYKENLEGQVIGKLQEETQCLHGLILLVEEKKHYKKVKSSSWLGKTVHWFSKTLSSGTTDRHQVEAQVITDDIMEEAKNYLEERHKKDTDFKETYIFELIRLLDKNVTEKSAQLAEHLSFLPQYRIDVYLTVCRHAVRVFERMAQSFKEKHDPRLYLEKHIKSPLFVRFKSQYYQTEAEEAIANNICAYLYEPIRVQVQKLIGCKIVGQMKGTEPHFNSKMALKIKILGDLHERDDFDSYMLYVRNVKKSFNKWIRHYIVEYCDKEVSSTDSRLQALSKEEVSQLIDVVERKVTDINETDVHRWLSTFCDCSELKVKLGVKLRVENLLTDDDNIQQLNLDNFKLQIRVGLQILKQKLHSSLDGIKCESEIDKWKDKPSDLLRNLIGCTAQCPFCGEQCDMLDPEHDVSIRKHRASVHRPKCLAGWTKAGTKVLSVNFCPARVAGEGSFHIGSESNRHLYKKYQVVYPDWSIQPDPTSECSMYWMSFVSKYNDALAKIHNAEPAPVPEEWAKITWLEVKNNLKQQYNL